jgi:leucyl/phenylalanyl-tRNA--protein transferase
VELIDCQMTTGHLLRFGAREIDGNEFLRLLGQLIQSTSPDGTWKNE